MTDTEKSRLAETYAHEYMGKIFYYCLRKTGDSHEAEELASDIPTRSSPPSTRGWTC